MNNCNCILALFIFDLSDATVSLPNNRGPNILVNVMSTNERIKIEKNQTVVDIFTDHGDIRSVVL